LDDELAVDEPFAQTAELDQVLDGTHLDAMLLAELAQVGQSRHGAVGMDDFAEDGRVLEVSEAGEIDAALGMASADENAAVLGAQAVHMPLAADEVDRRRVVVDGDGNGACAIEGAG